MKKMRANGQLSDGSSGLRLNTPYHLIERSGLLVGVDETTWVNYLACMPYFIVYVVIDSQDSKMHAPMIH